MSGFDMGQTTRTLLALSHVRRGAAGQRPGATLVLHVHADDDCHNQQLQRSSASTSVAISCARSAQRARQPEPAQVRSSTRSKAAVASDSLQ